MERKMETKEITKASPDKSSAWTCSHSGIQIVGLGRSVPSRRVTNEELSRTVDTSDEWIRSRSGIESRYFCGENESQTDLAERAARAALADAGITEENFNKIKLVIVATVTPEYAFPSTACLLQQRLGLPETIPAFDISAACSGFVYGLKIAADMLGASAPERRGEGEGGTGSRENGREEGYALVVAAEKLSGILDFNDRTTCVLFGDGAGAAVVKSVSGKALYSVLGAKGNTAALSCSGVGEDKDGQYVNMDGRAVFRFAVGIMEQILDDLSEASGVALTDADMIVCHQANARIIESVRRHIGLDRDRIAVNIQKYGNTSSASIPIVLSELKEAGRLKPGDRVFCTGFGAGLTWAGIYLEM